MMRPAMCRREWCVLGSGEQKQCAQHAQESAAESLPTARSSEGQKTSPTFYERLAGGGGHRKRFVACGTFREDFENASRVLRESVCALLGKLPACVPAPMYAVMLAYCATTEGYGEMVSPPKRLACQSTAQRYRRLLPLAQHSSFTDGVCSLLHSADPV